MFSGTRPVTGCAPATGSVSLLRDLQCLGLLSRFHKAVRPVASRAVIHGDTQLRNNAIAVLEFLGIDGDGVEFPARVKTERFHFIRELPE